MTVCSYTINTLLCGQAGISIVLKPFISTKNIKINDPIFRERGRRRRSRNVDVGRYDTTGVGYRNSGNPSIRTDRQTDLRCDDVTDNDTS